MTDILSIAKPPRHSWGEPIRFPYKTERMCSRCHICKVTRHEPGEQPWLEFYRGLDKIGVGKTPPCETHSVSNVPDSADGAASAERETIDTTV